MLIKDIFVELRSRLRSCNVYITTCVDFTKNCNLKINIQANCIVLNYYDNEKLKRHDSLSSIESLSDCYSEDDSDMTIMIPVREFCQLIPNSMSCLKIDKSNISFRLLTEPENGGNFYKELLLNNNSHKKCSVNELKINVNVKDVLKIMCTNCSNTISDNSVKLDRILELPSENLDMSEWFCHAHGNSSQTDGLLVPNKKDFLYRLTYCVVNNFILSEKTNKFNLKRDIYHCNRCLAWLGIKVKDTVKLFNSEVTMEQNGQGSTIFFHKSSLEDLCTSDFIYTIENIMREFNLGFQYAVMCKIVLECPMSANNKQYLLIWVMDKELQVLRNKEYINRDKVVLQSSFLKKILYKVETTLNVEVETWLTDPTVVSTQISKGMFCNGLEHLEKMSLKVPEPFRNTNGYRVTYLKV